MSIIPIKVIKIEGAHPGVKASVNASE